MSDKPQWEQDMDQINRELNEADADLEETKAKKKDLEDKIKRLIVDMRQTWQRRKEPYLADAPRS